MSPSTVIGFIIGTIALIAGAELLVRGASRIAASSGLSPVVIGLTVVAFGTSAPEFAVSVGAALRGTSDIALGNVVGSNIANILLVLGLSAIVGSGLVVAFRIVRVDVPLMIGASLAVMLLGLDGSLGRIDGAVFVLALVGYLIWMVRSARDEVQSEVSSKTTDAQQAADISLEYSSGLSNELSNRTSTIANIGMVAVGLVMLVIGANLLVDAATALAASLGASEFVIGLTVVAVGTSLPEIATSVVAAARGHRDLAVGNAVGSNLFNILGVLGTSSLLAPIAVSDTALKFDIPFMLATAIACLPIFINGFVIKRWEGFVFVGYYVAYLVWLGLDASSSSVHTYFQTAMLTFVIPLTVMTLAIVGGRSVKHIRQHAPSR